MKLFRKRIRLARYRLKNKHFKTKLVGLTIYRFLIHPNIRRAWDKSTAGKYFNIDLYLFIYGSVLLKNVFSKHMQDK